MIELLGQAVYIFCEIMECLIIAYIILSWLPIGKGFKQILYRILDPLFSIIHCLMKHSVFRTNMIDFSPYVAVIVVAYIQSILTF